MSYVVLARKYRPQNFENVVGQIPVSQTLLHALQLGRVAHAYVFSGPRGVGKTTTARILAKCLNCVNGPTQTPCHQCESCRTISQGTSMDDVLEIDGASNRGIEQIRELRESAKYAPSHSRYRIYIIDEAHQITKDAFGALLKTLEEPPPHVVFMMATTEVHKIPTPILSRCQRFALRPIAPELVFQHLKSICEKENLRVEEEALAHMVRFVEGSMRDALSLLDQALVFSPEGITRKTITDLLGLLPSETINNFADTINNGDPSLLLRDIDRFIREGLDLTQLAKDLQSHYHHLLLTKAGVQDSFRTQEDLKEKAARYDFPTLERNIRLLSRALEDMRHSDTPRAVFEVFALRLAQKTLDPRTLIERLEKLDASISIQNKPAQVPLKNPYPDVARLSPAVVPSEDKPKILATADVRGPEPAESQPEVRGDNLEALRRVWPKIIEEVSKVKQALSVALEEAQLRLSGEQFILVFDKAFNHDIVNRSLNLIEPLLEKYLGIKPSLETKLEKGPGLSPFSKPKASTPMEWKEPVLQKEAGEPWFEEVAPTSVSLAVQKVLKHFPGTLKKEIPS